MGPSEENNVAPSLLLRGLRPLGRQQNALPCHPLTTRGRYPPSPPLPRGGSMHQTPRKFGRAQTTDPAEFSWCRAGVSASIEVRQSQGWATSSLAFARREPRTYVSVCGAILLRLGSQGKPLWLDTARDRF